MLSPLLLHRKLTLILAGASLLTAMPALAEAPMRTDDAGTLDQGGMKVEGVWRKDDQERGGELAFGFSPVENLELGIAVVRAKDRSADPDTQLEGVGFGIKWAPYQNDQGWSLGASFAYGRLRVHEYENAEKFSENEYAISGLASYRLENGQVLHLNFGGAHLKAQGESDTVGTWAIGYEFPLLENLQLTAETYGAEHVRSDTALGLRYEIFDGFKISGAIGHGNDRSFGKLGFAWEF